MLPPETNLEVRSRLPERANAGPPLLFVHGGYCDAWCWEHYFLPWFAARGYPHTPPRDAGQAGRQA